MTRRHLPGAALIACPGCYSTAAILALAPAVRSGLVRPDAVVDAASGVSGAGRSVSLTMHFAEAAEDFKAYAVEGHRHLPEMTQALGAQLTAVEAERARLAAVLATMADGVIMVDGDGRIALINTAATHVSATNALDSFGHSVYSSVQQEDVEVKTILCKVNARFLGT